MWTDENSLKMSRASMYGNYLDQLWPKWQSLADAAVAAEPNRAHQAIAKAGWPVITQNIDGLHQRAGSKTLDIHGSVTTSFCLKCKVTYPTQRTCPNGHTKTRLAIVLFGERIYHGNAALNLLKRAHTVVYIGTSGNVMPVAGWYKSVPRSVLVDPQPWGDFTVHHQMTATEWADSGCPM